MKHISYSQGSLEDESFPFGKSQWRTDSAIARHLRNRDFLKILYGDDRTVDILFRYFSGETLRQIGDDYGLSGERIRQICSKSMFQLRHLLTRIKEDKNASGDMADMESTLMNAGIGRLYDMGFSTRALNIIRDHGITTMEQLSRMSREELLEFEKLGNKTLDEIVRVMGEHNLELRSSRAAKEKNEK